MVSLCWCSILAGLIAYYRSSPLILLPLFALTGTVVTSYVRARGQSLGANCKEGLMQRAERLLLIGLSCLVSPVVVVFTERGETPTHYTVIAALGLLALLSNYTALFRIRAIYNELDEPAAKSDPLPVRLTAKAS